MLLYSNRTLATYLVICVASTLVAGLTERQTNGSIEIALILLHGR